MQGSGYSYSSIWEPNDQAWPEPPSNAEIAVATADVRCKQESQLVETYYAVETAYQRRLIDKHQQDLSGLLEYADGRLRNATEIVSAIPRP
jgi:hypothetical protein